MSTGIEYEIDARALRRRRNRIAVRYDSAAVLPDELGRRMLERLDLVRLPDGPVLDLGCATGAGVRMLRERYPEAAVYGAEASLEMLALARARDPARRRWIPRLSGRTSHWICAEPRHLPFRPGSFSMIWANLVQPVFADPPGGWRALGGLLQPGGLLTFTMFGPDTLGELRYATRAAGLPSTVMPFADMHDVGDALVAAGFSSPVMDMERITLTYADFGAVARDLRDLGAADPSITRRRGLLGRAHWAGLSAQYERFRENGRLPVTVEVVYGHAWWPEQGPARTPEGVDVVRFHRRPDGRSGKR